MQATRIAVELHISDPGIALCFGVDAVGVTLLSYRCWKKTVAKITAASTSILNISLILCFDLYDAPFGIESAMLLIRNYMKYNGKLLLTEKWLMQRQSTVIVKNICASDMR